MTATGLDYTGKINSFLLVKKEGGLAAEKVPIYLNLLKFLVSHFSQNGLVIEEIEKPADEVMQIRFEGIDPETQQEYLQLFLDFMGFCKKTASGMDAASSVRKDEISRVGHTDDIKCPKCGTVQARSSKCAQCGIPMTVIVKRHQYEPVSGTGKQKKSAVYLAAVLIAVFIAALLYQFLGGGRQKIKGYEQEIMMNTVELGSYVDSIKEYIEGTKALEAIYKTLNTGAVTWEPEHENILGQAGEIMGILKKIKVPSELGQVHRPMVLGSSDLLRSLEEVKGDLYSQRGIGNRAVRTGRAFTTVVEEMDKFIKGRDKFVATINFICKYNDSDCKL